MRAAVAMVVERAASAQVAPVEQVPRAVEAVTVAPADSFVAMEARVALVVSGFRSVDRPDLAVKADRRARLR